MTFEKIMLQWSYNRRGHKGVAENTHQRYFPTRLTGVVLQEMRGGEISPLLIPTDREADGHGRQNGKGVVLSNNGEWR